MTFLLFELIHGGGHLFTLKKYPLQFLLNVVRIYDLCP